MSRLRRPRTASPSWPARDHVSNSCHDLAIWEVCNPARHELAWPMPWSLDGSDSFVVDAESLRAAVEEAGFRTIEWTRESTWVQAWIAKTIGGGPPAGPTLPMLLDDGYTRIANFATALTTGVLDVWRGCFTKNPTE